MQKRFFTPFFVYKGACSSECYSKGTRNHWQVVQKLCSKKLKKCYIKRRSKIGFKNISLLHDNAPAQKSKIVTAFLRSERVIILSHPPYSSDLAPCDSFLFPRVKKHMAGKRYTSRHSVGSAVYQCIKGIPTEDYKNAFKRWIHRLKLCVSNNVDYFEGMK